MKLEMFSTDSYHDWEGAEKGGAIYSVELQATGGKTIDDIMCLVGPIMEEVGWCLWNDRNTLRWRIK